jgi:hypothetical protein
MAVSLMIILLLAAILIKGHWLSRDGLSRIF